jgi:fructose-specific PTS system IIA-like component
MSHEFEFDCPLPNGLHARPASQLAEIAARFAADVKLSNVRTRAVANGKSVLDLVAADVGAGDKCRIELAGEDAADAYVALREWIERSLPICDEPCIEATAPSELALPRVLREANVRYHAGTIVCPGIGQGVVVSIGALSLPADLAREHALSREVEQAKVAHALASLQAEIARKLDARPSAVEAGILRAHHSIVGDVGLRKKMAEHIDAGASAGQAIVRAAEFFAARLNSAESAYVRERAIDVQDIGLQMLEAIYGDRMQRQSIELDEPSVLAAENLTPRQILALDKQLLKALVLEHAGSTSHAVILARSFDIPTLTGVAEVRAMLDAGREVIVDANLGVVIPEITPPVRRYYGRAIRTLAARRKSREESAHSPVETCDGMRMEVGANVATAEELAPAFAHGADGIGLFRTEMLFMGRDAAPSEEEQFAIYSRAARAANGKPVILRTFDIGGDKPVPYLALAAESNPFLGFRGARLYREHRELFASQVRAMARASAFGDVRVMLPMISTLDEARWAKNEIANVQAELAAAGIAHDPKMKIGVMIEVPSAAFIVDRLAREVDFFSIGTNDLSQYFLAADRDNAKVAELNSARDPAFLRLLKKIVDDAHASGRWVGMCGEMTRSPRNLALLVGLGLDEISTAAPEIPTQKAAIAALSAADCRAHLEAAMNAASVPEVEDLVAEFRVRSACRGILSAELVTLGSDSISKAEVIHEIVDALHDAGRTDRPRALEDAIWAREDVYSTGLGHGFAIPHCKSDAIGASSIALVRLEHPIEWGSLDGAPVSCVILLATRASDPDNVHMQVFAKLARKLMHEEFRERMLAAADRDGVLSCLSEELGL